MKNLLAYSLIFLVSFPLILMELGICYERYSVRKEVKSKLIAGLEEHELVRFEFSDSELEDLNWVKDDEFELNGLMYDVVSIKSEEDYLVMICFPDKQETTLNKQLEKLRNLAWSSHIPSKKDQHKLIQFFKCLYFELDDSAISLATSDPDAESGYLANNTQPYHRLSTPPPEQWL